MNSHPPTDTLLTMVGLVGLLALASAVTLAANANSPAALGTLTELCENGSGVSPQMFYPVCVSQVNSIAPPQVAKLTITTSSPLTAYVLNATLPDVYEGASYTRNASSLEAFIATHPGQVLETFDVDTVSPVSYLYTPSTGHPVLLVVADTGSQSARFQFDVSIYVLRLSSNLASLLSYIIAAIGTGLVGSWAFVRVRGRERPSEGRKLSANSTSKGEDLESMLAFIASTAERWHRTLLWRSNFVRAAGAVLVGVAAALVLDVFWFVLWLRTYPGPVSLYSALMGLVGGGVAYYALGHREDRFSSLVARVAKLKSPEKRSPIEDGLVLIDEMLKLAPEVRKERIADAWLVAVVVWLAAMVLMQSFYVPVLFGVMTGLFLTLEFGRAYQVEKRWCERLRSKLDQDKEDLLQSL
jgi:hypothetical protein